MKLTVIIAVCGLAPIRHLEYSFSVAVQGLQGYKFDTTHGAGVQTVDRLGEVADPEGGSGTMYVDVMSVAPDGALVVRISELVRGDPPPRQPLGYLGCRFIDGASWDKQGHWQRTVHEPQYTLREDFTLTDAGNDRDVKVSEIKKVMLNDLNLEQQTSQVSIDYDRVMEVPDVVRDDVAASSNIEASHASYVFTLVRDSFAKPTPH